jgi:hypothetical protein
MNLENLFWLVLLVIYLIFQVMGSKKKRPQRPPERHEPSPSGQERDVEPGLEDALREIREMLNPQPQPRADRPEPVHAPPPARRPERATGQRKWPERSTTTPGRTQRDQSHFKMPAPRTFDVRKISTQPLHWQGTRLESTRKPSKKLKMGAIEKLSTDEPFVGSIYRHPLLAKLSSTKVAREAVILTELLGPPKSLRKRGTRL